MNEKLNKENRAGNIQALKNDLKLADRALQIEKEKLRSANVTIGECQDKIRCLTPVSYTHLDVYKRQAQNHASPTHIDCLNKYKINKSIIKSVPQIILSDKEHLRCTVIFFPVSYTHLSGNALKRSGNERQLSRKRTTPPVDSLTPRTRNSRTVPDCNSGRQSRIWKSLHKAIMKLVLSPIWSIRLL